MKAYVLGAMACLVVQTGMVMADDEAKGNERPMAWGPKTEGCRVALSTDRESYRFDEPIRLKLTVENVSGRNVHLIGSPNSRLLQEGFRFDVRLPNGEAAPLTLEGKRRTGGLGSSMVASLESGKSVTAAVEMLNRRFDMTLLGEYTVTIYWHIVPPQGGEKPTEVRSNTLKIVVHDETAVEE